MSAEYVDSGVGTNENLFVTLENKGTETDSDCHQLKGTLRETISLLKVQLRNKQVTIYNLIDVINNFRTLRSTKINIQETKNKKQT